MSEEKAPKGRILVVDDEAGVRSTLERALSLEGYSVTTAASGTQALEKLGQVDLVLSDLMMPDMDGIALLEGIRQKHTRLPVAIMTAHGTIENAVQAMRLGAYDYLLKPCQTDEILLKVELGLKLARQEADLIEKNEALTRLKEELEVANARLKSANVELSRLATTDSLTLLSNRRKFIDRLHEESALARRYERALALIVADIDDFKKINDAFGHPAGDRVLRIVAENIAVRPRETDLVARIGGEEFGILLPSTDKKGALELAESIRDRIEHADFAELGKVTLSLGVAELDEDEEDKDGELMLKTADEALYRAKAAGKNQVC